MANRLQMGWETHACCKLLQERHGGHFVPEDIIYYKPNCFDLRAVKEKRFNINKKKKPIKQLSQCGMCRIVRFGAFAIGQGEDRQLRRCAGQQKGDIPTATANTKQSSAAADHRMGNAAVKEVRG